MGMGESPRLALIRPHARKFEVETDQSHTFVMVRPFSVQVFDAFGEVAPQVMVTLAAPDHDEVGRITDTAGVAQLHATVMSGDVVVAVADIKPREAPVARPVPMDDAQAYDGEALSVPGQRRAKIQLPPRALCVRLLGMLFDTDKTFLRPEAIDGMRRLEGLYRRHPGAAVLVVGHTDRTGEEDYNETLSRQRADAVAAFLTDDVQDWLARYATQSVGQAWGIVEDQHMLGALTDAQGQAFYVGPAHGNADLATQDAVTRFQTFANAADDAGLVVDGILGPATREPLVTRYMAQDGTTLPADATLVQHGCGEHHPTEPVADGEASDADRRTEVFVFEHEVQPEPPASCGGCDTYAQWLARSTTTIDIREGEPRIVASEWEI